MGSGVRSFGSHGKPARGCPSAATSPSAGDGQGERELPHRPRGFGAGRKRSMEAGEVLGPFDGGELPSSSPAPGCCSLLAPGSPWGDGFILVKPFWGPGVSETAGLRLLEIVMSLGLHLRVPFSPSLTGGRRRQVAAVLLANLSLWKEEMPLSALDLHLPACTGCTGFSYWDTARWVRRSPAWKQRGRVNRSLLCRRAWALQTPLARSPHAIVDRVGLREVTLSPVVFRAHVSVFPALACRDLRLVSTLPPMSGVDLCGWDRREDMGAEKEMFLFF